MSRWINLTSCIQTEPHRQGHFRNSKIIISQNFLFATFFSLFTLSFLDCYGLLWQLFELYYVPN